MHAEEESTDFKTIDELRYAAIVNGYYQIHIEADKILINWSTLSIAGLLTLGIAEYQNPYFLTSIWVISLVYITVSCLMAFMSQCLSKKEHTIALAIYPKEKPSSKFIAYFNSSSYAYLALGLIWAAILVGVIIFKGDRNV